MKKLYLTIAAMFFLAAAVSAAEVEVLKPKGNLNINIGHPSTISLYDAPVPMTNERLNKNGWNVKDVEFIRTDLNSQALAQGTVQMAVSQILDPLRAIGKGSKVVFLMENNGGEFVMIAKKELKDCKAIDGKRFAIHGETSTISLAVKIWLLNECKIKPTIVIIPGGENRVVALQNNQIDATLVQMSDWLNLDVQAPGRYHVVDTGRLFNISGASLWANTTWLAKNEEVATAYTAELLKTFRMIHANPKTFEAPVLKYVPDTQKKIVGAAIKSYLEIVRAWPQNGGDTTMLEDTIKFFTERGELKPGMEAKQIENPKILVNALKIVGKIPGQR
jgi:ABC-type nitrate/sulfonate/bicarbonate transport system substrate-binding protein